VSPPVASRTGGLTPRRSPLIEQEVPCQRVLRTSAGDPVHDLAGTGLTSLRQLVCAAETMSSSTAQTAIQ
jgi:hypothetical protein